MALFKVASDTLFTSIPSISIKVAGVESVCWQQPLNVSDGCLTIPSGLRLVGLSFVFQQDSGPKHTSRLCKGYLTKESDGAVHLMTWPPQSPALHPIEMVWDELDRIVNEKQPTSAQHMWELLEDCWKIIPYEAG